MEFIIIFLFFRLTEIIKTHGHNCNVAKTFREFQLLEIFCNTIQRYMLGAVIMASILDISIPCSCLIHQSTRTDKDLNCMMVLAMLIAVFDGIAFLLVWVCGILQVSAKSKLFLCIARYIDMTTLTTKERKWSRRFYRSSRIVKIKFGDDNFLENLTPLRCLDFSAGITLQILLLSSNY